MPYYIYSVRNNGPVRLLEHLESFDAFAAASARAKQLRREVDLAQQRIQVVFGDNQLQAEEALNTVRPAEPLTGDDW